MLSHGLAGKRLSDQPSPGTAVHHNTRPHRWWWHRQHADQQPVRPGELSVEAERLAILITDTSQNLVTCLGTELLRRYHIMHAQQQHDLSSSRCLLNPQNMRLAAEHTQPISSSENKAARHRVKCKQPSSSILSIHGRTCFLSASGTTDGASGSLGLGNSIRIFMPSNLYEGCGLPAIQCRTQGAYQASKTATKRDSTHCCLTNSRP